jgi:hypothetical protein
MDLGYNMPVCPPFLEIQIGDLKSSLKWEGEKPYHVELDRGDEHL